jgi:hypothetical protein
MKPQAPKSFDAAKPSKPPQRLQRLEKIFGDLGKTSFEGFLSSLLLGYCARPSRNPDSGLACLIGKATKPGSPEHMH